MIVLKKNHYILALFILVLAVFLVSWKSGGTDRKEPYTEESQTVSQTPEEATSPEKDAAAVPENPRTVGVWIPYMALSAGKTEEAFKQNFEECLETAASVFANAVFVHVRPFADSLYPSEYEPWSHILTGEQGKDPGFDPLEYMISAAHEAGMAFHAWINPLRISTGYTPEQLSEDSFYRQNREKYPYYFLEYENGIYYNPASAAVRSRIAEAAAEIVEKYNVDGIHFDDYFYPSDDPEMDRLQYMAYAEGTEEPLTQHEWRTANINALIAEVYGRIKAVDPSVRFGISPQGNLENNALINADVRTWCAQAGYIDYICPQLYYSLEHPTMPFEAALQEWCALERLDFVSLYIGLAAYKAGTDEDNGTWQAETDILQQEARLSEQYGAAGIVLYAVDDLAAEAASAETENLTEEIKKQKQAENTG